MRQTRIRKPGSRILIKYKTMVPNGSIMPMRVRILKINLYSLEDRPRLLKAA
jgi:hypothetical protein